MVWSESKLRTLTGGDKVSTRFMRQDPFEFTLQHLCGKMGWE